MRTVMGSALLVFLVLVCFPVPSAAQLKNSAPTPLRFWLPANPPSFGEKSVAPSGRAEMFKDLPSNQANALRALVDRAERSSPFRQESWKSAKTMGTLEATAIPPADRTECAHMLIARRQSADSKMVVKMPNTPNREMPMGNGLPPCREDFR
jgi:hypothetical protein